FLYGVARNMPQPFRGAITPDVKDSKSDFPQPIRAPAGAPNVLLVLLDDVGFGATSPVRVSLAYSSDSSWRNRDQFISGRGQIQAFLTGKWQRELDYRLIKELWAFDERRIAVRFQYEWHNDSGQWFRSYGNELWEFDDDGLDAAARGQHQRRF